MTRFRNIETDIYLRGLWTMHADYYSPNKRLYRLHAEAECLVSAIIGCALRDRTSILSMLREGFDTRVIVALHDTGFTWAELSKIVSPRVFKRRQNAQKPLTPSQSEKALNVAIVFAIATEVWGSRKDALNWLRSPSSHFDGAPPMALIISGFGARMVEEVLGQAHEGYFA